jgi:hypothetical protein
MSSCMYHVGIVPCISMWHVPRSSLICRDHFKIVDTQMSLECLSRLAIFSRDSSHTLGPCHDVAPDLRRNFPKIQVNCGQRRAFGAQSRAARSQ